MSIRRNDEDYAGERRQSLVDEDRADREELVDPDEFEFTDGPGITLSRGQLEAWAGRPLSEDEIVRLEDVIPDSSIPEAVATIVDSF